MNDIALIFIEIDIRVCSLTYGVSPCTAALGVTGDEKCFNTRNQRADCQDPANFTEAVKTLRFGLRDSGNLPADIDCYPLLRSAKVVAGSLKPGESFGERSTLTATFHNGKDSDAGLDPYVTERGYIAFDSGTFWGKFRARNTYLEGQPIRIIRGYVGQSLAEMDVQHFIIDSLDGPNSNGQVTIKASDFMKQLNDRKSLCPIPSKGSIDADYPAGASNVDLLPVGIGDAEYPEIGRVAIGKEVFDFTRLTGSDTLALSSQMQEDHKEGETAQLTKLFDAVDAATITDDLVVNFTPLDSSYTDLPAWLDIVSDFIPQLYTREIVKPTPVRTLLNELINQAGLVVFGNTRTQQISWDVLRANPDTGQTIDQDAILRDSFRQADQPSKRFSEVVVYYDKRDVFASNEPENYLSAALYVVPDDQYPTPNTLRIFSNWIQFGGLSIAQDVAVRAAARYKFPPLSLKFNLAAENVREVGQVVRLTHPAIETATGAQGAMNAIITGASDDVDVNKYDAEEYNIDADLLAGDRVITIDYDVNNINLRDLYDSLYSTIETGPGAPAIVFIVNTNVVVGSNSTSTFAMQTGDWEGLVVPELKLRSGAFIVGRGGNGGFGAAGTDGGNALEVTSPIDFDSSGTVGGGGGGGGGGIVMAGTPATLTGGGGAGRIAGTGDPAGGLEFGGVNTNVGDGGDLGQDGTMGTGGPIQHFPGGDAGNAINGVSLINFISSGTILGAQVG